MIIRCIDIETTGLDPSEHRVVEVGVIDLYVDGGEVMRDGAWQSFVDPGRSIPPEASGVHDITDETVAGSPSLNVLSEQIMKGPPDFFCSHNTRFDSKFLPFINGLKWMDTYRIAAWAWPYAPNFKLGTLRYFLKLKFSEDVMPARQHSALPDAVVCAAILRKAILGGATIDELWAVSSQPAMLQRLNFGEHAMKPIAEVPDGYLHWILQPKQRSMDEDVRFTAHHELRRRQEVNRAK